MRRWLFFGILLAQAVFFVWAWAGFRLPAGRDGFQYFSLQYYFLNNAVFSGEIAQWMPFMTHGTVASWWYSISAGLLQQIFLLSAPLWKDAAFHSLFLAGMFVDELALVTGCWLWMGRFFLSPLSLFFLTASAAAACLWWTQPWHNFHNYYCLPLVFHLGHRFLETQRRRFLLMGLVLLIMSLLGSMPYFLPVLSFVMGVYFACFLAVEGEHWARLREAVLFRGLIPVIAAAGILTAMYYTVTTFGTREIVSYTIGRDAGGATAMADFLTYGGNTHWGRWKELFLGFSPEIDYTLYGGLMVVPFLGVAALLCRRREALPFVITALVLLDFSSGGLSARLAYHLWPFMNYFRHIALTAAIAKLFLFALAAFGVDALAEAIRTKRGAAQTAGLLAVLSGIVLLTHWRMDPDVFDQLVVEMTQWGRSRLFDFQAYYQPLIAGRLKAVFWFAVVFFACAVVLTAARGPRAGLAVLTAMVLLHAADAYTYKVYETKVRSFEGRAFASQLEFAPMPFADRRHSGHWPDHPRAKLIAALPLPAYLYWSNDSFLFRDPLAHDTRTDHWLRSLDGFLRQYASHSKPFEPLDPILRMRFPSDPTARLWAGAGSKVQWLEDLAHPGQTPEYQVRSFTANRAEFNLKGTVKDGWLLYSDAWHPEWRARTGGTSADVIRAGGAYKAVKVGAGTHNVAFEFYSSGVAFLQKFLAVVSVMVVAGIFWLAARSFFL